MEVLSTHSETIDEKIRAILRDAKRPTPIEVGSDAFLDKVLEQKEWLENISSRQSRLNELLINCFNTQFDETTRLLTSMKELHVMLLQMADRNAKGKYGLALKGTIELARIEIKQLREIIDDANLKSTIKADSELQSLFSQL